MTRRSLLFAFSSSFFVSGSVLAQDAAPAKPPSQFERWFPYPTGDNGFEEVLRAADRLQEATAAFPPASEFTLTLKRAYLADPACQDALALVRQGAQKQVIIPQKEGRTGIPPLAEIRAVMRLLGVQVTVQFADGKSDAAVRAMHDGLLIAAPLKSQSLVALAVGNDLDALVLTPLAKLREVWTPRDCERLALIARQQLALPDPAYAATEMEHRFSLQEIAEWRKDIQQLAETLTDTYTLSGRTKTKSEQAQSDEYEEVLQNDPAVRARVIGELSSLIQEHYDRAFALIKDPSLPMTLVPPPQSDTKRHPITVALRDSFLLNASSTLRRGAENRVSLQLLAVHAAIRAFCWEYDKLPATLAELSIEKSLLRDPFTKTTLLYTVDADGATYRLASAGALLPSDSGKPVREPVTLPREAPKAL